MKISYEDIAFCGLCLGLGCLVAKLWQMLDDIRRIRVDLSLMAMRSLFGTLGEEQEEGEEQSE